MLRPFGIVSRSAARRLRERPAFEPSKSEIALILAFIIVSLALFTRLRYGIDLTDESYYAEFVYDWLKEGLYASPLRTLHQTAALIYYPFFKGRAYVTGSQDHLVLILRMLYLFGLEVTALVWMSLARRIISPTAGWIGACFVLAFVPFGLPAPSYNTLGQQGMMLALSFLGLSLLREPTGTFYACLSAAAWAIATVAYPSTIIPLSFSIALLTFFYGLTKYIRQYFGLVAAFQAAAWSAVVVALSPVHLMESIQYMTAINDVGGWNRKLQFSTTILSQHPVFFISLLGATLIGLVKRKIGSPMAALCLSVLIAALFLGPPALYCRSHDVITILAMFGVGLFRDLNAKSSIEDRIVAIVWSVSLVAGITTMITAFNSIFNFAVGAMPAAIVSISTFWDRTNHESKLWKTAPLIAATAISIGCLLSTSIFYLYGDLPNHPWPSDRVTEGPFAGLVGQPEQVEAINWVRQTVSPMVGPDRHLAFFGWPYGLVLASDATPMMLAIFPLDGSMNQRGLDLSREFFSKSEHRASLVVIDRGIYTVPFNPMGDNFDRWYEPLATVTQPLSTFSLYRRRQTGLIE